MQVNEYAMKERGKKINKAGTKKNTMNPERKKNARKKSMQQFEILRN